MRGFALSVILACALFGALGTLAGCGQTGPLYLPKHKPMPTAPSPALAPVQSAPTPATAAQTAPVPATTRR